MSDPVRLGDVLARELQRLDARCKCGHPMSKHDTAGGTCDAIDRVGGGMPLCIRCACNIYREVKCTP